MWVKLFILIALVSTIQCQGTGSSNTSVSYEDQITTTLNNINTRLSTIVTALSSAIPALQSAQSAIVSLSSSLPNSVVNDKLAVPITTLDALALAFGGTSEAYCFQNLATTKFNALQQVRQGFTSCTAPLTTENNQFISTTPSNVASLNALAYSARQRVSACGNNYLYRFSIQLFTICLTSAQTDFNTKATALESVVAGVSNRTASVTNSIALCIGQAVNKGEIPVSALTEYVKTCTARSSLNLSSIITSVTLSDDTFLTNQLQSTSGTTATPQYVTDAETSITNASTAVTTATNAKADTFATAKTKLETKYANEKTAYASAADRYATSTLASTCVYNIRYALTNNINRQAQQYIACLNGIRSGTLSSELSQIQTLFRQRQTAQSSTNIQCLTQVDNLFVDQGIVKCKEDAVTDDTTNCLYLQYRAATLTEEANMVTNAAGRCYTLATKYIERQNQKDQLSFQTCILRTTRETYTFTIPSNSTSSDPAAAGSNP